jgi:ketosteroid isomerase-like protein
MKRLIIKFFAIVLFSTITIVVSAQSVAEMKSLVSTWNKELIELAKAGRFEAMGKYYDEEAISMPNYRAMEKGYKLILNNNLGRKNGGYKILDGSKNTVELFVGENMLVDIGSYTLTVDFPGLSQPKNDAGKYMNVWRKDKEGNWRIIAETWNADKTPNPPKENVIQPAKPPSSQQKPATTGGEQQPVMDTKEGKK